MHVVVIGAGVIGVTTAYYLTQLGCEVTVIDRESEVATGASHANAGQLSYSFTDALAKPEFIAKIPALLAGFDRGSKLRFAPSLLPWAARFLMQCTNVRARNNTVSVLKIAAQSARLMAELRETLPFDFSHRSAGKLLLISDNDELKNAEISTRLKKDNGSDVEILNYEAALAIEPALAALSNRFVAAVHSKSDEVADARLFTRGLKKWLEQCAGVTFRLGSPVTQLVKKNGHVEAVRLTDDEIEADATIVCSGAWSGKLLRPLGINPHIYPVRGYSVTLPTGHNAPSVSVTALRQRIVFSRINGAMRIAGFADFRGFDTAADNNRIASLVDTARSLAPQAANYLASDQHQWGGFRPMTPDGKPRVGRSGIDGLYLNTGHGMLGWTLACASGYDIAQTVARSPA